MLLQDKQQYSFDEILKIFELTHSDLPNLKTPKKNLEEALKAVEEFKSVFKKQYRKLAMKYHPDQGGNEEDFKILKNIYDHLMKIQVKPIEQPVYRTVYVRTHLYSGTTTTSTYWY